jgi:hypothetical protein
MLTAMSKSDKMILVFGDTVTLPTVSMATVPLYDNQA